jgi:sigma-B regulation protein RsbU (phosphoserine phosphatase)
LQLARQIQQTFLPEVLPHLDGWELSVRWRTARQVGGDFYDVFELPDGRIGLVIADVADKGMPAALFMTLVRTLIRAAVRELSSPAAVLERVNELLIPDTRNGMFVTVVYAVLTVATGELVYANAGHNPPLLLAHATGEIQRLLTGGMALGIMEDIVIPGRSTVLEQGDFLLFYTDGITEAFSPNDEMYGEDRLHVLLRTTCNGGIVHAQDVLDAIDISVDTFTHDEDPSDDVTMIAVLRG